MGAPSLRQALARKYDAFYGMAVDPEREITGDVRSDRGDGVDPGDEVIILEPFYENYGPDAILCAASPVFLTLEAPAYRLERDRLEALITSRTKAIALNTPNNPMGRGVPERGSSLVRFAFCKKKRTLLEAGERLRRFAASG